MSDFAIVEHARAHDPAGVLMLLDDRAEAEAIVAELRRRGQEVGLKELRSGKAS